MITWWQGHALTSVPNLAVGGNTVNFSKHFAHVHAIEIDPQRASFLQHNVDLLCTRGKVSVHEANAITEMQIIEQVVASFQSCRVAWSKRRTHCKRTPASKHEAFSSRRCFFSRILFSSTPRGEVKIMPTPMCRLISFCQARILSKCAEHFGARPNTLPALKVQTVTDTHAH